MECITAAFPNAIGQEAPGGTRIVTAVEGIVHARHGLLGGNDVVQTLSVIHCFHYLSCVAGNARPAGKPTRLGQSIGMRQRAPDQAIFCR